MVLIILVLVLIIALMLWKNRKVLLKVKTFFKKCKLLIVLELVILIGLLNCNIFNGVVRINEKDPHSNKILKCVYLKEGEIYEYKTMYYEESDDIKSMLQNYKEKTNIIKIEDIGITEVKVSINEVEKDYKYGTGFSYYSITSCSCGTPIVFERMLTGIIKIMLLGVVIINLFLIIFIKIKEENK